MSQEIFKERNIGIHFKLRQIRSDDLEGISVYYSYVGKYLYSDSKSENDEDWKIDDSLLYTISDYLRKKNYVAQFNEANNFLFYDKESGSEEAKNYIIQRSYLEDSLDSSQHVVVTSFQGIDQTKKFLRDVEEFMENYKESELFTQE